MSDCTKTSIGKTPLDSGPGLYGDGQNMPPHLARGIAAGKEIIPRLPNGQPAERGGKIVLAAIGGMSNAKQEFQAMINEYRLVYGRSRRITFYNGNIGAWDARRIAVDEPALYWQMFMEGLAKRNISPLQVQAGWIKNSIRLQARPFPQDAEELELYLGMILDEAIRRLPNLKQVFISSAIYSGYGDEHGPRSEPHAHNEGHGVRSLVLKRLDSPGPYVAWGPYLWADGLNPRPSDSLVWKCEDFMAKDGIHPSDLGKRKVAKMLLRFFENNQATAGWFKGQP
jgi:hypothetical protein